MGQAYGQRGEQTAGMWSGIGSGLAQAGMQYGTYLGQESRFDREMGMREKELAAKQRSPGGTSLSDMVDYGASPYDTSPPKKTIYG